jgi:hypothetical protein
MSPLQLFLIRTFEADPTSAVPLVELVQEFINSLDGSEDARWRDRAHIVRTLSRTFSIGIYNDQRCVAGLSPKVPTTAVVSKTAPLFIGASKCHS